MNPKSLPEDFSVLAESRNLVLGHFYEVGMLIRKDSGQQIYLGDYFGDPDFGLIDKAENWVLLCGQDSYLWTPQQELLHLNPLSDLHKAVFNWPFAARQADNLTVQILDGPLDGNPSAFQLNIHTLEIRQLSEIPHADSPRQWGIDESFWRK